MKTRLSIATLFGFAAFASLAAAEEKELTTKQVPQAVQEAFQKAHPAAKHVEYSEEAREGKTAYEIEFKDQGKELEAVYSADGALIETGEEIKISELPEAVVKAVKKDHPHAVLKEAEKLLQPDGSLRGYEIEVVAGKQKLELEFDPNGTLINTEVEHEGKS